MARAARVAGLSGGAFALGAALAFGGTTPLVQREGRGVGPFTTAALLYGGSALFALLPLATRAAPLVKRDLTRVVVVTLFGAVLAPVSLAWGLQRTSGVSASLLLNLEGLFTVILARMVWGEPVGRRLAASLLATLAGGVLLVLGARSDPGTAGWGAVAVIAATLAWAGDSVLSRPLSEKNTAHVVLAKGLLGAALSGTVAVAFGESRPSGRAAIALVACGVLGYGASLRLYLAAQRRVGAARTGTFFAAAPFMGAAVAWAMGQRASGTTTTLATALCAVGVVIQLVERHDHEHTHPQVEHDHPHRHDDGHHTHVHDPMPAGEHAHPHAHAKTTHAHPHALDEDHRHEHGDA